jgi:TonB family protein
LYSDEGRSRNIEGSVIVEVRVGLDGRARDLRVVAGLGFGLDENALLAVRDWRFSPAKRDGKEVEAVTRVDVEFNVRNAELNEVIANDMATRVGPGVVPPGVIHRVEPQYPQAPTSRTRSGTVLLDAVIQENGVPKVVRVLQSLGWELDESAITALEQWRFSPAMKNGMPIKVRMNVEMTFGRRS